MSFYKGIFHTNRWCTIKIKYLLIILLSYSIAGASDCTDALNSKDNGVIDAVKNEDTEALKRWIANSYIDLSVTDKDGRNALNWAARLGNAEHANLLVNSNRIDIHAQDKEGYTALVLASVLGYSKVVGVLLTKFIFNENVIDEFHTAYVLALKYDRRDVGEILDETPFGYHVAIEEIITIMEEGISLRKRKDYFEQVDEIELASEIADELAMLEAKTKELFEKIVISYTIDNDRVIYFRSKTLNRTVSAKLSRSDVELINAALSSSQNIALMEEVLEVFKNH